MSAAWLAERLPAPCGGCDVPLGMEDIDTLTHASGAFWCVACANRYGPDIADFAWTLNLRSATGGKIRPKAPPRRRRP